MDTTLLNFPFNLLLFEEPDPQDEPIPDDIKEHPYVKAQNAKLAAARVKEKERKDAESEAEKTRLKEQNDHKKLAEKLQKDLDTKNEEFRTAIGARDLRVVNAEIKSAAQDMGARSEALSKINKFLDFEKIEINDEGDVTGVDEQLKALKEEMPFLFGDEPIAPGNAPRRPARTTTQQGERKDFRDVKNTRTDLDSAWKSLAAK